MKITSISRKEYLVFFVLALGLTTLLFLPSIAKSLLFVFSKHHHGALPNFIIYADQGQLYTASIVNLSYWLHHGFILQGVDWLTSNGASEFYLRANIPVFYPPLLLMASLFKIYDFHHGVIANFGLIYTHALIGLFFLLLLCKRFFNFSVLPSLFLASLVFLSYAAPQAMKFLPFFMAFSLFPFVLYCTLSTPLITKKSTLFLLSFVYFSYALIGYLPLALMGMSLSLIFALIYWLWIEPSKTLSWKVIAARMLSPMVIAALFSGLGILSMAKFVSYASQPYLHGLEYSAYSLPEAVTNLGALLTSAIVSNAVEHYIVIGLIAFSILLIYLLNFQSLSQGMNEKEQRTFKLSVVIFVFFTLISFGKPIVLSALFFYLVPGLGAMHIYQRYYFFASLFLAIPVTLALKTLIANKPLQSIRYCLGISFIALLAISLGITTGHLTANPIFLWTRLLSELLLLAIALLALLMFSEKGAWTGITLCLILTGLPYYYFLENDFKMDDDIVYSSHQQENAQLIAFFKRHSPKSIIKYANLTSTVYSYVPRNYPWLVQNQINLSNYNGYEEQISQDEKYRAHIPWYGQYNWQWLRRTGADFIIYDKTAYSKYKTDINKYTVGMPKLTLSNGDTVVALNKQFTLYAPGYNPKVFDNGYIQVQHIGNIAPMVSQFSASPQDIHFHLSVKGPKARLTIPFWANRHIRVLVNNVPTKVGLNDGIRYQIFNRGDYKIDLSYHFPLLQAFLYMLMLYYGLLLLVFLYWLYCKLKPRLS